MSDTLAFWMFFAIVNSLYFLPKYLLDIFHTQFFPVSFFAKGPLKLRLRHLLIRKNYDIFRISTDLFILSVIYPLFLREFVSVQTYTLLLTVWVGWSLLYQVYYGSFHRIYQLDPVFFHDFLMIKTAGQIFIHDFGLKNLLITITGLTIGATAVFCLYMMVLAGSTASFGTGSFMVIVACVVALLYSLKYTYSKYPQLTFQSQLQSLFRNLLISKKSRQSLAHLTLKYMKTFNVHPEARLQQKPNIYFIVVESYGRIAIEGATFTERFQGYATELEQKLREKNWQMTSGYTLSPVTGGASWISYTSLLYGLNVRNQGVYLTMLKNKYMPEYDSLFHWLKRQGYVTFRISSLGGYEKMEIPYDSYSRLYGIDHWVKYKDLEFRGEHFGFGPSPPDQYALSRGNEMCVQMAQGQPRAVFFISQNSHTPYDTPQTVAEDWRTLNSETTVAKKASAFWSRPKFEKYGEAIEYQLRYLTAYILSHAQDNDIFLLIGDHQPPSISIPVENWDTPMHVIAKNADFIERWKEYGFAEGLTPSKENIPITQESVHWALLRSILQSYGDGKPVLPDFLPRGIEY